ncbi:MAG TPA: hypothetical protein VN258_09255 [Mobilitalea sp.]|nr:hypothetical protein [Mobilitalea sp.]
MKLIKNVIKTGKYETGSEEQKNNFILCFGSENTQETFDIYFHWYNVIHEFGHILFSMKEHPFTITDEEQLVNNFAVAYWKYYDMNGNLIQFLRKLTSAETQENIILTIYE